MADFQFGYAIRDFYSSENLPYAHFESEIITCLNERANYTRRQC
jgi:hypothetical protein